MSEKQRGTRETFGLDGARGARPDRRDEGDGHDHHGEAGETDHLASIYEGPTDQFEAVVPFIERGLAQDEKCLYVADDNTATEVIEELRAGGVDVDAALESGALSVHTKEDTYTRTGEFERDDMLDFWRETLAESRDEEGYTGVRAAAEMTWALDEGTDPDRLVEYEAMLNAIYAGDDYAVLCQYNRDRFPDEVISDVIRSHPRVVYDGTVCGNFHYHPPEEFFEADRPSLDVERTVEGLVSRARARRSVDEQEEKLHARLRQQDVVADLGQRGLEEQDLDNLFADVTERVADTLDADYCGILQLDADGEEMLLREGVGWQDGAVGEATVGTDRDSQAGYTLRTDEPVIVDDLSTEPRFDGPDPLVGHDVKSGISVTIGPADGPWGVMEVHTRDRREFSRHDASFVRSVANTVATAIERAERERYQRELYELTSSPELSFEEKLQGLFDLGCARFDMELGGVARIDPTTDLFEVEHVSDEEGHDHLRPGARVDLSETYCRVHVKDGEPTGITAPGERGFHGTTAHEEFGVKSYLGTRLRLDGDLDRTFFFVSTEPRESSFSEDERTFHHLMGQWLRTALERQQYERRLEESNERLEQFAYAASHDLQEPLRMVSSYLRLIERRYGGQLDADGREFIDFAVDGADRMRDMIDGLLEYSRVETEGESPEPVDLDAVFEDVRSDLRFQIAEADAEVTAESLPRVEGDASQLRQVFQNLLDNAIEYSGDDAPDVRVAAEWEGSMWRISVADDGVGIDPEDGERVFEVFQRLHTHEEHAGTGIGLAICRRIVERHGGDIWVVSEPGEGATFSFTLPPASDDGS